MTYNKRSIISIITTIILMLSVILLCTSIVNKLETVNEQLNEAEKAVNALYTEDQTHLVDGLTESKFIEIKKSLEIDTITNKQEEQLVEITKNFNTARNMFEAETLTTKLINDQGVLNPDVTTDDITVAEHAISKIEMSKPELTTELQIMVQEAETQLIEIENATALVYGMFSDIETQTVREDVTRAEYDIAVATVSKIEQVDTKNNLLALTNIVDEQLTQQEEAEKAQEEAQMRAEIEDEVEAEVRKEVESEVEREIEKKTEELEKNQTPTENT